MPISVDPGVDIPLPAALMTPVRFENQFEKARAAIAALNRLVELGATIGEDGEIEVPDDADSQTRASIQAMEIAAGQKSLTPTVFGNAAVLLKLQTLLTEYDKQIIRDANQLRTYVKNKLVEESINEDPKIRIRALELLGKVTDVGLFTEKTETTIRHGTTEELESLLRKRLEKVIELDNTDYSVEPGGKS